MDIGWTTSGLALYPRAASGAGRRERLERTLREAIRTGRWTDEGARVGDLRAALISSRARPA